jgi:hypothetical protein
MPSDEWKGMGIKMTRVITEGTRAFRVRTMIHLTSSKDFRRWSKEIGHAVALLILTISLSILLGEFTFLKGSEAVYKGLFRFLRLTLVLCLPAYLLSPMLGMLGTIVRKRNEAFLQIMENQALGIQPVKHWLLRPLQGIGLVLILGARILWVLEMTTGEKISPALLIPKWQFEIGRFLVVTGVIILISLLLSVLWTLDDLGIRYFSRKNHEIKMIGKYVGTLMPVVFGFSGAFTLLSRYPTTQALVYLIQIAVILYPPFTVFSVFHAHFLRKRARAFLHTLAIKERNIWD